VGALRGVGPRVAEQLAKVGVTSAQDLLFHLPLRYQDRTRVVPIADLKPGAEVLVEGEIGDVGVGYGRRRSLKVWLADVSGQAGILLRFFHFSGRQATALKPGTRLCCFGEVRQGPQSLEMVHPEYRHCGRDEPPPLEDALTPIYPTTEGLQQSSWRLLTDQVLALLDQDDARPEEWCRRRSWSDSGFQPWPQPCVCSTDPRPRPRWRTCTTVAIPPCTDWCSKSWWPTSSVCVVSDTGSSGFRPRYSAEIGICAQNCWRDCPSN